MINPKDFAFLSEFSSNTFFESSCESANVHVVSSKVSPFSKK